MFGELIAYYLLEDEEAEAVAESLGFTLDELKNAYDEPEEEEEMDE